MYNLSHYLRSMSEKLCKECYGMEIISIADSIFLSLILIGSGFMCKSMANGKANDGMGYRTKLSKKNADTWKEANIYGGKMLMVCGVVYLVLSLIGSLLFSNSDMTIIVVSMGIIPVILVGVFFSEKHLRNMFDSDGNRK